MHAVEEHSFTVITVITVIHGNNLAMDYCLSSFCFSDFSLQDIWTSQENHLSNKTTHGKPTNLFFIGCQNLHAHPFSLPCHTIRRLQGPNSWNIQLISLFISFISLLTVNRTTARDHTHTVDTHTVHFGGRNSSWECQNNWITHWGVLTEVHCEFS